MVGKFLFLQRFIIFIFQVVAYQTRNEALSKHRLVPTMVTDSRYWRIRTGQVCELRDLQSVGRLEDLTVHAPA